MFHHINKVHHFPNSIKFTSGIELIYFAELFLYYKKTELTVILIDIDNDNQT